MYTKMIVEEQGIWDTLVKFFADSKEDPSRKFSCVNGKVAPVKTWNSEAAKENSIPKIE